MLSFTSDQWVIVALIFVLGLLVGGFLFSGGGRKWKTRYNSEIDRRKELERLHGDREKEWRDQEKLHAETIKEHERALAARPVAVAPVAPATHDPLVSRDTIPVVDRNDDGVIDDRDR